MDIRGYVTGVKLTDYQPRILGYGIQCDDCCINIGVNDMRVRDMLAHLHFQVYGHFPQRTRIIQELWTPFNPQGYVDDERLAAEGWHTLGTMKEDEGSKVMARQDWE